MAELEKLERDRELVLDFKVISPEARAMIDQATTVFIDTKIRDILEHDATYCRARGWMDAETQSG